MGIFSYDPTPANKRIARIGWSQHLLVFLTRTGPDVWLNGRGGFITRPGSGKGTGQLGRTVSRHFPAVEPRAGYKPAPTPTTLPTHVENTRAITY